MVAPVLQLAFIYLLVLYHTSYATCNGTVSVNSTLELLTTK